MNKCGILNTMTKEHRSQNAPCTHHLDIGALAAQQLKNPGESISQ